MIKAGSTAAGRLPVLVGASALALGVASALGAAPAAAATISIATPCVIYDQATVSAGVPITGSGFTAGDNVSFQSTPGDAFGDGTVGPDGTFAAGFVPPTPPDLGAPAVSTFTLSATDGAVSATTSFLEAPLAVATKPARAKPNKTVTFDFSGFASGAPIYAHYLHKKKVVATKRFGIAHGPCGVLGTRSKFFPGRERYDNYTVQVDDARKYSPGASPKLLATLTKTFR
ncbi:MAG TPA: hypothetical protein VG223_14435 [Solirubrobacteraceae bacterium]|jgi:hypothetical protein|nr:hypothetical protein [Solirubrobacteraceae bacterium]